MRSYPILSLITDRFNPLERTDIEVTGGSRPRLYLQYRRTRRRVLLKTYRHTTAEIYSEYLASRLAQLIGIKVQSAVIKRIPGNVEAWMREEAGDVLPSDWNPVAIEVQNIFPNKTQVIYGKDILGDPERRLSLDIVYQGIVSRFDDPDDLLQSYSDMVVFDALIGNMDRHHENWGICVTEKYRKGILQPTLFDDGDGVLVAERYFTPLFDHGSSLMFELPEHTLQRMLDDDALIDRYINKSYGFILDLDHNKANIFTALKCYIDGSDEWRRFLITSVQRVVDADIDDLKKVVNRMPVQDKFGWTITRNQVLAEMIELRYNKLQQLIEER